MLSSLKTLVSPSLAVFALVVPASVLAKDDKAFLLSLRGTVGYDDNVTVDQTDLSTGVGDASANLDASVGYKFVDNDSGSFAVGYDFSQILYQKQTALNIQSHGFSANGDVKAGGVTLGGGYSFYHLLLGGRGFLNMHMINPSISGFVTDHIFVRGDYIYFDKGFVTANTRDTMTHQPGADVFYFFDDAKAYFAVGARYEKEDASGPAFDYGAYILKANLQLPLNFTSNPGKINFGYQYMKRNYDNITPSIGVPRRENRNTFSINGEIPIADKLSVVAEYNYIDRNSNLPSVSYTESVVTGGVKYDY